MKSSSEHDEFVLESPYTFSLPLPVETTVPEYLLSRATHFHQQGRKEWITNTVDGETFNFGDVEPLTRNIASGLCKRGLKKNDVVLFTSHDGSKSHLFFIGVWRANGQVRLSYSEDDVETQVERILESKVRFFVCDDLTYPEAQLAVSKVPWPVQLIVFSPKDHDQNLGSTSFYNLIQDDGTACPQLEITKDDISLILATSGTTGASKGAYFTHQTTLENFLPYEKQPFSDDLLKGALIISKTTHFIGSHIPMTCLSTGKRTLMIHPVDKENICQAVHQYKPQGIYSFPKFLLDLVDEVKNFDLTSIKLVLTAGTVIGPSTRETIGQLPSIEQLIVFYGMTECGFFSSTWDLENRRGFEGVPVNSVGKLGPDTKLKVIDIDTGMTLGPNEQGELCFQTKLICGGYLNKPKETEQSFPNGWILTGDLGFYDSNGFIFVIDRIKEVFKYGNNQIAPSELERVISGHPNVTDAYVIPFPNPETRGFDHIPKAFISLQDNSATTPQEIMDYANSQLAPYKQFQGPQYIVILKEFPLGKTGKVSKALLAQINN